MTQIYDAEISDGLEKLIASNKSIAYECVVKPANKGNDNDSEKLAKALAGQVGEGLTKDLYFFDAILASVGTNSNGDVFLPEEIYAARNTPVLKQVNYMHNEKDIIGTIFDSVLLDVAGNTIVDESQVPNIKDIVTRAVIWSQWSDPDLQKRLDKVIAQIENGSLFVSMECLFNEFDYMLVKGSETKIVKRNKETAFLTKYLKWSGGSGEYQDYLINRVLRKFLFSGKGIVENPANKRSIISDNLLKDENKPILSQAEIIMTEKNFEAEANELKSQLAKATEELVAFKKSAAEQVSKEIDGLKASNAELVKQVAELTQLATSAKEDMEKMKKESEAAEEMMKEECEAKVKEAEAKVVAMLNEKVTAERKSKLAVAGVDEAKVEDILKTWATADEAQFEEIAKLYAKKEDVKTEDKPTKSQAGAAFDIKTDAKDVNLNVGTGDEDSARQKAIAEKLALKFTFNKKNKKENGE